MTVSILHRTLSTKERGNSEFIWEQTELPSFAELIVLSAVPVLFSVALLQLVTSSTTMIKKSESKNFMRIVCKAFVRSFLPFHFFYSPDGKGNAVAVFTGIPKLGVPSAFQVNC